jgi:hypothetical protein
MRSKAHRRRRHDFCRYLQTQLPISHLRRERIASAHERSDFAVKLAIRDLHCRDGVDAKAIIDDLRYLLETPALTTALDFAASKVLQVGRLRPPLSFAAAGIVLLIRNRSQQTVR